MENALELALGYQMMAEAYVNSLIDEENINESSENFELIMEANDNANKGFIESIVNAINALINGIKTIIAGIANFLKTAFMTKEEKAEFKEIQKFLKDHPEYSKKQIYVPYYPAYEAEFKSAHDKIDDEMGKDDPDERVGDMVYAAMEERMKRLKNKCAKNTVRFVGAGLDAADKLLDNGEDFIIDLAEDTFKYYKKTTFNAALDAANHNDLTARNLKRMMDNEIIDLEKMKKECGTMYTAMFKMKVNRYAKKDILRRARLGLRRAKIKLFKLEDRTFRDVTNAYKKSLGSYYNGYKGSLNYQMRRATKELEKNKKFFTGGATRK